MKSSLSAGVGERRDRVIMEKISPTIPVTFSSIDLTDRDMALLRTMLECRVLTVSQAADLHFEGRLHAARKRISKLKSAGVIAERPRRVYHPAVLFLTSRAFALLEQHGVIAEYPILKKVNLTKRARVSPHTLNHELAVMDVRCAFTKALIASNTLKLLEFCTWPAMYQFDARPWPSVAPIKVRPDGYLCIEETTSDGVYEDEFYLELDRSTESQQTLAIRSCCYRDFYLSGGNARRHGQPRDRFKEYPFRVLMIFQNDERRNNAALRLLHQKPPILSQVWLSTFAEVKNNPLGSVWITPADYRQAVAKSAFDANLPATEKIYRRRPQRELLVQTNINKHVLIEASAASSSSSVILK